MDLNIGLTTLVLIDSQNKSLESKGEQVKHTEIDTVIL